MTNKPTLLILSFSQLASDARLLKQIRAFVSDYAVTTCGFGPAPVAGVEHLELQRRPAKLGEMLQAIGMRAKLHRVTYWLTPHVRQARRLLTGRQFDAVFANDLDTIGVALAIADPASIHLDLHEFWTGIHDDVPAWKALRAPHYAWQLRHWATRAASVTTINTPLAERYQSEFGLTCGIVTNATEFRDLTPGPVATPLRLVHSGGTQPNRKIERMMHAIATSETDATLDLFLIGEGTAYHRSLCDLADELGDRVRVLPPVGHAELIERLNEYDVGLPFLPPTTTNIRMTLPNKFFDYVQARLAILTGPTPPMTELVDKYDLGLATSGFDTDDLVAAIESLTPEQVQHWKEQAHKAAKPLSAEEGLGDWIDAIEAIVSTKGAPA